MRPKKLVSFKAIPLLIVFEYKFKLFHNSTNTIYERLSMLKKRIMMGIKAPRIKSDNTNNLIFTKGGVFL
mgnify:CR=1 FL=1